MRAYAFQLTVLMAGLLAVGPGCSQGISAAQAESEPDTGAPVQSLAESAATNRTEEPPPATRPEPAPSTLEFTSTTPAMLTTNSALEGVVRQLRAGVEETVLLAYISSSPEAFSVGSEEIIYLTDLGAPGHVINAMIEHDQQLQSGSPISSPVAPASEPWPPAGTVAQVPATPNPSDVGATPPAPEGEAVAIEPPATEVSVDFFYDYLAPYGNWVDIPGYGLCWQPGAGVATAGWTPYGDRGRWVYTNYGWYWYSDYSWGWATFHYGRWQHNSRWGWCWVPGTVWGPSWVSWRYYDSYCGWAPLPPYTSSGFYFSVGISWGIPSWCYTYVPAYNICTYYPRRCAVPYAEAQRIHGRAKAYDNYAVGRNHVIHNRGIPPETLARNSRTEIQRAQIRERTELPAGTVRRERMENDGRTLTVYQPRVAPREGADRSQTRPASRDAQENSGSGRILGGRPSHPVALSTPQSTANAVTEPTTRARTQPTERPPSLGQTTPGTSVRSTAPAPRDGAPGQASPTRSTALRQSVTTQQNHLSNQENRRPESSLVIVGGNRSRPAATTSAATPTPSPSAASRTINPTRQSTANATPASSQPSFSEPRYRAESTSPTRSIRSTSTAATPTKPTRSVAPVPAPTRQSPTVTRTTSGFPTRLAPQPTARAPMNTQAPSAAPQVRTQTAPRSSFNAPPQRSATFVAPPRTYSPPSQTVRSAPAVRAPAPASPAPRSSPSYSPPSTPRPPSAPSAPSAAPPGRGGDRSSGRSR